MWIESLECKNFRNYRNLSIEFDKGLNFLYGDNAQGKTNIIEAVYICSTSRSHKGSKDKELIFFGEDEAHIRLKLNKKGVSHKIDFHIRKNNTKGVAINGFPIKKASELFGLLNVVVFSPEDLFIVKNGPSERRRFIDRELCRVDPLYLKNLSEYNKVLNQRNKLLKDISTNEVLRSTLDVWDEQFITSGKKIIRERKKFLEDMTRIMQPIHNNITGDAEDIILKYEPSIYEDEFEREFFMARQRDLVLQQTTIGPHRDDFSILVNGINIRKFGSQGQQRSAALSLKLSEIKMIKKVSGDDPVLLLDDVFSELDSHRQECLLSEIKKTQTILTGTGLDDLVRGNIKIDKLFYIKSGNVSLGR